MALTMRHGPYNKFDPQKLRTGEVAVVTEGDPHASDGKAIYQCFSPGDVKRMATYEDMVDQIDEAGGAAIDRHIDAKTSAALKACEDATSAAKEAEKNATLAQNDAELATADAQTAAKTANTAAEKALNAMKQCEGIADNSRMMALEKAAAQAFMTEAVEGSVTGKTVADLPENAEPKDTDCILTAAGNNVKKTSVKQVKDMLGIDTDEKITEVSVNNVLLANNSSGTINGTKLTLNPGYYVITAQIDFPANATGKRQIAIRNITGNYGLSPLVVPAVSAGGMNLSTACIVKVTDAADFSVFSYQNSGAAMTLTRAVIRAIKIFNITD